MHRKMGAFFICFMTFTGTLVYSVVWDQSLGRPLNAVIYGSLENLGANFLVMVIVITIQVLV